MSCSHLLTNLKVSSHSCTSVLLFVALLLYTVAFFSNEWFIFKPSHYGLWSVTFCDVLTCQTIPTVFNDQPGWYFLVQLTNVLGITFAVSSCAMLFMKMLLKNKLFQFQLSTIATVCQIAVFSTLSGILIFFGSLIMESKMSIPTISWASSLASIACILQTTACIIMLQ